MHAAANNLRGGVSPRNTRLRGQSIIEYVLIAAVIGLVVIFAGPQVTGAIRNQFSQVANTVDAGTDGDSFMSAEEKAYREAMKTVASKDAKDWTLDEQKAAATDIAKNGTSSVVYAKAKAAMDARVTWRVQLTNGRGMTYRIIGINHDDLADGSGKAGLTFLTVSTFKGSTYSNCLISARINTADANAGGWKASELRAKMNSGEIWALMPSDFQSKVKVVKKLTNNVGGGKANKNAVVTATSDKLFLLSCSEIVEDPNSGWSECSWIGSEGTQYEAFKDSTSYGLSDWAWTRSATPDYVNTFIYNRYGSFNSGGSASEKNPVYAAFCF